MREDLQALATTVDVIDDVTPDLLDATEDALVFTNSLIKQEAALTALITGGVELPDSRPRSFPAMSSGWCGGSAAWAASSTSSTTTGGRASPMR